MRHEGNCRADTTSTSDTFCIASHCLIHSLPWSPILPVFTQLTSQWADLDHIEIEANHDCAKEQTKGNKLEPFKINQVASPLGNFLTTPLSIYPLVSLSLHGVAASPQIIEATEPCERQSEIGRWEMHEITKRMKILSGVYVSASERRRCWGVGVISFMSVAGHGVKYSLFHRPLGGVGPKRHSPFSSLTLN